MSLRLPQSLFQTSQLETGASVLDGEILAEKAAALGHAGKRAEEALLHLRNYSGPKDDRAVILQAAIDAVYAYFIQRELCGFPNHDEPIAHYGIPAEVLVRLGAR
ncbi:DUF6665 family protein [Denitrobaculum tricleocarpae]|uniref:Uncharacterized protein n=1 Tax=Denitrobaculum tricleocarpae TaxID=2591009 RepID=A0A545U1L3_9PROT|nr:DUF6665 family protein [Denitrobaculum tricleocarpae]TQV83355.1 hypothetical protein FKG95_01785 [Denitrobaculum tricleocarpae]